MGAMQDAGACRDVERILSSAGAKEEVEVIVQMEREERTSAQLARAAGEVLSRRRLSLSPRELLPEQYRDKPTKKAPAATASASSLMGRATAEALALAAIKEMGLNPLGSLLESGVVRAALSRTFGTETPSAAQQGIGQFWTSRSMLLRLTKDELAQLPQEVPGIRSVCLNRRLSLPTVVETKQAEAEVSELFSSTWGLQRVGAPAVWGIHGARGSGIKIGLLDTGVDAEHPDLQGKVTDWAEFDSLGAEVVGSQPHDSGDHGTHCAGTLVGGSASGRVIGMAPEACLAAALVIDADKGGTDAQVLAGIDWAVNKRVDVISMSLGGLVMDAETPPTYTEAILTCLQAGIPVVIAIGNEGAQTTGSPGNDLFALSVGAIDAQDRVAGFSGGRTQIIRQSEYISASYLPLPYSKPDLAAPGVAVYSTAPGGKWKAMSGTSMATPHVAGAIALLLSATHIAGKEDGSKRAYVIQDLICGSVDDKGEAGQDHRYGFGVLNVLRAVDFAHERGY